MILWNPLMRAGMAAREAELIRRIVEDGERFGEWHPRDFQLPRDGEDLEE